MDFSANSLIMMPKNMKRISSSKSNCKPIWTLWIIRFFKLACSISKSFL